jgi:NADH:ubiquinone oxidoreductase subunit 2 (subunit N)
VYVFTLLCLWSTLSYSFLSQEKYFTFFYKAQVPLFLSSFKNVFDANILSSFALTTIFFSMAGLPPLSGFISKLFILLDLISENFIEMSLILILISAISVFYYIKVIKILVFESISFIKKVDPSQIVYNQNQSSTSLLEFISIKVLLLLTLYPLEVLLLCECLALSFSYL